MPRRIFYFLFLLVFGLQAAAWSWEYSKNEPHPDGARSLSELDRSGEYYNVTGADLHNVGPDLIGKKIALKVFVREINRFPVKKLLLLSEDRCYFLVVPWGSLGEIPDDLKTKLLKGGVRAAGGGFFSKRYDGDKITLFCLLESIVSETGINRNVLRFKQCLIRTVDKWEPRWVTPSESK